MKKIITTMIERYYDSIYYYCVARMDDADAAKDCTQEVFYVLVKKQSTLSDLENIRPWLYRTADYAMKEYKRRDSHYITTPNEEFLQEAETFEPDLDDGSIQKILNETEYSFLWKHYIEGYTVRELAQQMDISEATAYMRLTRIRRKIIDVLKQEERRNLK